MEVFKRRWFMWDLARQRRFDREEFLLVINKLADLGYNGLGLYLEGAFEFKSLGGVLREGNGKGEMGKVREKGCMGAVGRSGHWTVDSG